MTQTEISAAGPAGKPEASDRLTFSKFFSQTTSLRKVILIVIVVLAVKGLFTYLVDVADSIHARRFDRQYMGSTKGTSLTGPLDPAPDPEFITLVHGNAFLQIDTVLNANGYAAPYCAYMRLTNKNDKSYMSGTLTYIQSRPLKEVRSMKFRLAPGESKVMVPYYTQQLQVRRYQVWVDQIPDMNADL